MTGVRLFRWFLLFQCVGGPITAADLRITGASRAGEFRWTNALTNGVAALESTATLPGRWQPGQSVFVTNGASATTLVPAPANHFFRIREDDLSPTGHGFTNLLESYGVLETLAGSGLGRIDGSNYWRAAFEGGFATNAALSRPHFAMADASDNIYIVDKDSHSVLKVTPDGRIHTVAGTHAAGDGPNTATPGISVMLSSPNGLWVRPDGVLYVLDTGNGKVRRLDSSGLMTTLFTVGSGINVGRGLWVSEDESLTYFSAGTELRRRVPGSVSTLNNNFTDLGNIILDPLGNVIATDRGDNKVFVVDATGSHQGSRTRLFGDGSTNAIVEGTLASTNGLYGVRGIWPVPTGGYLLATHEGSQVLHVDTAGIVRTLVRGAPGDVHAGDGTWFYAPGNKIAEPRAVTMDSHGHLLITENDAGFIRRIRLGRLQP